MLLSVRLGLQALSDGDFPGGAGVLTHALALELIRKGSARVSQAVHDGKHRISTSGILAAGSLPLEHVRVRAGDRLAMRIGVCGEDAVKALMDGLSKGGSTLDLGRTPCMLVGGEFEQLTSPNPVSLDELWELAAESRGTLRMHFESPTTFRRGPLWLAMPSPENVFGSFGSTPERARGLAGKWAEAGGASLPRGFSGRIGAAYAELAPFELKVRADNPTAPAFLGSCDFSASSAEDARALWALGKLACFTGVGWKTSMGAGQISVQGVTHDQDRSSGRGPRAGASGRFRPKGRRQ